MSRYDRDVSGGDVALFVFWVLVVMFGSGVIGGLLVSVGEPGKDSVLKKYGEQVCRPLCKNEYRVDYKPDDPSKNYFGCSCIDTVPVK